IATTGPPIGSNSLMAYGVLISLTLSRRGRELKESRIGRYLKRPAIPTRSGLGGRMKNSRPGFLKRRGPLSTETSFRTRSQTGVWERGKKVGGLFMSNRPDKRSRKEALERWAKEQRKAARAKLPLPDDQVKTLFDMLDVELPLQGCDHTL